MKTTTLFTNGDMYEITHEQVSERTPGKRYIYIEDKLNEVINMVKVNDITITDEMSSCVLPHNRERFKIIESLIRSLMRFNDSFTKQVINIFSAALEHKNFTRMNDEFTRLRSGDNQLMRNRWTPDTRCLLSEALYY